MSDEKEWTQHDINEDLAKGIEKLSHKIEELENIVQKMGVKVDFTSQESGQALKEIASLRNLIQGNAVSDLNHYNELKEKLKLERKVKVWDAKVINRMNKKLNELKERVEGIYKSIHGIAPDHQMEKTEKKERSPLGILANMYSGGDKVEEVRRSHPLGEPSPNSDISLQSKPPEPHQCAECWGYRMGDKIMHNDGCSKCSTATNAEPREERSK